MELAILLTFVLSSSVAGFGREWNTDRNRFYWFFVCLGLFVLWALPNWWLKGLVAVSLLRFALGDQPLERIKRCDDSMLVAAVVALAIPALQADALTWLLWAIVLVGSYSLVWTLVSYWKFDKEQGYKLTVPITKWWHLRFYEFPSHIAGGQGNPNHLHGVCAVAVAASIGLGLIGIQAGYWLAPLFVVPMAIAQFVKVENEGHWKRPQQGWAHLLALGLASLPWWIGPWGWAVLGACTVAVLAVLYRNRHTDVGIDSGRGKLWWEMIVAEWWPSGWRDRLWGWGPKEFEAHYINKVARSASERNAFIVAHHPHSEYVCTLLEHGLVGLFLLTGYLATTLAQLWLLGPDGRALYLVGMALCSVAVVSFPWSFYHEILFQFQMPQGQGGETASAHPGNKLFTLGAPSLLAISVATVVMAEVLLGAG